MEDEAPQRVIDRIKSRYVANEDGCWIWPGATSKGYGRISWSVDGVKRWRGVHRVLYVAEHGPIPEGFDLDHTCHKPDRCRPATAKDCPHRRCINPDHMEPVTRQENLLRGGTVTAERSRVTHCPAGHAYSPENTLTSKKGQRQCKECVYERNRQYYWKNRQKRMEYNRLWRERRKAL